ncbi:MAG: histidine kinase, partial [Ferrovibrionaceae bacterium]
MSDRAGQARRRISTQAFLAALVLVLVGPGLVFTGLLLTRYADAKRESYAQEARNIARQTANAIDRDLTGLLNTLQAISTSSLLIQGDIPAFYNQVSTVRSFINADIGLRLPDGQMLVNTRLPLGAGLSRSVLPIDQRVIDTG